MGCQTEYRSIARSGEEKVANWPSYWRHGERGRVKRSSQKKREKVIAQKRKLLRDSYCTKKEVIEKKLSCKKRKKVIGKPARLKRSIISKKEGNLLEHLGQGIITEKVIGPEK